MLFFSLYNTLHREDIPCLFFSKFGPNNLNSYNSKTHVIRTNFESPWGFELYEFNCTYSGYYKILSGKASCLNLFYIMTQTQRLARRYFVNLKIYIKINHLNKMPSQYLIVQSHQLKHLNYVINLFNDFALVSLLLILNRFHILFWYVYCWLWTSKWQLDNYLNYLNYLKLANSRLMQRLKCICLTGQHKSNRAHWT